MHTHTNTSLTNPNTHQCKENVCNNFCIEKSFRIDLPLYVVHLRIIITVPCLKLKYFRKALISVKNYNNKKDQSTEHCISCLKSRKG